MTESQKADRKVKSELMLQHSLLSFGLRPSNLLINQLCYRKRENNEFRLSSLVCGFSLQSYRSVFVLQTTESTTSPVNKKHEEPGCLNATQTAIRPRAD